MVLAIHYHHEGLDDCNSGVFFVDTDLLTLTVQVRIWNDVQERSAQHVFESAADTDSTVFLNGGDYALFDTIEEARVHPPVEVDALIHVHTNHMYPLT